MLNGKSVLRFHGWGATVVRTLHGSPRDMMDSIAS